MTRNLAIFDMPNPNLANGSYFCKRCATNKGRVFTAEGVRAHLKDKYVSDKAKSVHKLTSRLRHKIRDSKEGDDWIKK